ncbi:MAG: hypothetical protein LAN18_05720 [Acidobacteriia bacterium]|nr:hypothetical protein [Terriglobia bacterium]
MSVTGIASSILAAISGSQSYQTRTQQIQSEFQQLGQDLQSGNLTQAQSNFTKLSHNVPGLNQDSTTTTGTNNNPIAQAFARLGQDLRSGNLTAAQQDYTTVQQDVQQNAGQQQVRGHHHHHHAESSQDSSSSSSQQTNPIVQAFRQLEQTLLQAGNLSGAQSAFSALQNDLQQIGGFITTGSSSTAASTATGSLNVTV